MNRRQFLHNTTAAALTASSCTTTTRRADKLIIDTHQHLWNRKELNLPWLNSAPEILQHDYVTADYVEATHGLKVKAIYMEVDVAPSDHIKEADAIVAQIRARNTPTVAATIGGRPASADFESYVQRYAGNGIVLGTNRQGESVDATVTLAEMAKRIRCYVTTGNTAVWLPKNPEVRTK